MPARQGRRSGGRHPAPHDLVGDLASAVPEGFWGEDAAPVARALLTSAVHCFARQGFHGTTTRDVTSSIGLSPGALYVHFASKEEVLFAVVLAGHERSLASLRAADGAVDAEGSSAQLARLVADSVSWHARHHVVARVCQHEMAALTVDHLDAVLGLRQEYSEVVRSTVERGVQRGVFDVPDVNHATRAVLSLGIDLVRWYRSDGPDSPEALGLVYGNLALRLVGADPPP